MRLTGDTSEVAKLAWGPVAQELAGQLSTNAMTSSTRSPSSEPACAVWRIAANAAPTRDGSEMVNSPNR